MQTVTQKLAHNTFIQIAGKALGAFLGVLTIGALTRLLGQEGYGQFTLIFSFLAIFAVLVDFGFTLTMTQMISEERKDHDKIVGTFFTLRLLLSLGFLSLAPIISLFFPYDNLVRWGILIGTIIYIFNSLNTMIIGVLQRELVMQKAMFAEIINRLIVLIGVLAAPYFSLSLIGIVWIFVLANAINTGMNVFVARGFIPFKLSWDRSLVKEIFSRSWPIALGIFFALIYLRGDILFLSFFETTERIGQYGAAYKVIDVMTAVPTMFMGLLLPLLTHLWSVKNNEEFQIRLQQGMDLFSYTGIPFAFGAFTLGIPVMEYIAGSEFHESGKILQIFGLVVTMIFFNSLFTHTIIALKKQKETLWIYGVVALITVIGYLLFIPQYGIWAAAWWTLIAEASIALLSAIVVWRISGFIPSIKSVLQALGASLVMTIVLLYLPPIHILLQIGVGMIVYLVFLQFLGGPSIKKLSSILFAKSS